MIAKVGAQGLLIPKQLLGTADEVEIREESGRIVVILDPARDSIWNLGKNPVTVPETDAAVNHDKYIYNGK